MRREAAALLAGVPAGSKVTLGVAPERLSAMIGRHRENVDGLRRAFSLGQVRVKCLPQAGGGVVLVDVRP